MNRQAAIDVLLVITPIGGAASAWLLGELNFRAAVALAITSGLAAAIGVLRTAPKDRPDVAPPPLDVPRPR